MKCLFPLTLFLAKMCQLRKGLLTKIINNQIIPSEPSKKEFTSVRHIFISTKHITIWKYLQEWNESETILIFNSFNIIGMGWKIRQSIGILAITELNL